MEDEDDEDASLEEDMSESEADSADLIDDEAEESDDPLATTDEEGGGEEDIGSDTEELDEEQGNVEESSESDSDEETQAEKERKAAFFASPDDPSTSDKTTHTTFATMSLSRPLLKALTALGFTTPTPIQAATIPVALLGKDVVGNAVTGSGKTAAFMIPVLERLMYRERGKNKAAVRCVVLVPTRELGVQCADVARKLAAYMDVRISLIVGMSHATSTRWYVHANPCDQAVFRSNPRKLSCGRVPIFLSRLLEGSLTICATPHPLV